MSAEFESFLSASVADQKASRLFHGPLSKPFCSKCFGFPVGGGGKAKKGEQKTFCLLLPKWLFVAFCLSMAS